MNDSGYMTTQEAADYLHVSVGTLREWVRTKGLPHYKPGKQLLFQPREIQAWMSRHRQGLHGLALTGFNERMTR